MKVKAKTNIKYNSGWVYSGEVFDAKEEDLPMLSGLVEAAEVKPAAQPAPRKEKAAEKQAEPKEEKAETAEEKTSAEKPKTNTTRRRKISE